MREKIVLMDGYSILNRAFYGIPELTNSSGLHTNAVYGFCNIMFKILEEEKPAYLAVAFDVNAPTFRHELYAEYKGTRKPMPQELREQVPLLKELLAAMDILTVEQAGMEADDVIGTLSVSCAGQNLDVVIVSGDRDLLQLAGPHVLVRIPKTKKTGTVIEDYDPDGVKALYGVSPREFIDVKALMGDSSDNIPGVPSIGEKTAISLIRTYHSIENAYGHLSEIKPPRAQKALGEHFELARLSKVLATIRLDCELDFSSEKARLKEVYTPAAYELCKKLEFKSLLTRFSDPPAAAPEETAVHVIDGLLQAESLYRDAEKAQRLAVALEIKDSRIHRAALAFQDSDTYILETEGFITSEYLSDYLSRLAETVSRQAVLTPEKAGGYVSLLNIKAALKHLDLPENDGIWDLGIAAYLLNPLKSTYDYDDLARDYLNRTVPSLADLTGKSAGKLSEEEREERLRTALAQEAHICLQAQAPLAAGLEAVGMTSLYRSMEMPLAYCLDRMEKEGVQIARRELREYGDRLASQITVLEQEIYQMTGENFNINSPKQLGEILFDKMKLPGGKKTKTGYSTAADVLEKLAGDVPVIAKILEYRQLTKLKSTYADGLAAFIGSDGRIHGTFNQTITATGRISSTEPNLQNIPVRMELGREIRRVFVPKEGCVFVDADYSQIELRVLAHMSDDAGLIKAYRQAQDIHRSTASQVFHIPLEEVTQQQRRNAKAVNFGIVYGISAFGLSEDLSISRQEALDYIDRYFATYPGVKHFLDRLVQEAREQGYVSTLYGRRRPVPELTSSNFMQRNFGERVAMNSPIQGTAADIMKLAMIRVDHRLRTDGYRARIILQIHDELLIETPLEEKEQVSRLLKEEMEAAASLKVPLEVDVNTGNSWFETK
ncbi:MAG: DNA polymerase I [Lachnospiraceae bacterium]|jgi:DNA polymerase-1|nr:DNA polymerase I [Lachnospiraceae bacterium]